MNNILAAFPAHPGAMENVSFIINGFLFVLIVLAILAVLTVVIGKLIQQVNEAMTPAPVAQPAAAAVPQPAPVAEDEIPEHVLVALAAAAHVALEGRPHRIAGVRQVPSGSWAQEGRRQIFSSHRVR